MKPDNRARGTTMKNIIPIISLLLLLTIASCSTKGSNSSALLSLITGQNDNSKIITSYSINGIGGIITNNTITVRLPLGTDTSNLVAVFSSASEKVTVLGLRQTSGVSVNNFGTPVVYTVHTKDGSTINYTVTVVLADVNAKDLISYSINNISGVFSDTDITVSLPLSTDVTNLTAYFTTSGIDVTVDDASQTSGSTSNDFTDPVTYIVHAENGTTKTYTVTVLLTPSYIGDILVEHATGSVIQERLFVWNGSGYGIVWEDSTTNSLEVFFTSINTEGTKEISNIQVTASDSKNSYWPSVTWSGTQYGLAWMDTRNSSTAEDDIYFCRLNISGVKQGSDVRVTSNVEHQICPSIAWNGTEYGIAWDDFRNYDGGSDANWEIYFARMSSTGTKLSSDIRVTNATNMSHMPTLVRAGTGYGLFFKDHRSSSGDVYYTMLNSSGTKQAAEKNISNVSSSINFTIAAAWTGSNFGVVYESFRTSNELLFERINTSGTAVCNEMEIDGKADFGEPSIVWNGSEYGMVFDADAANGVSTVYFARVGLTGGLIGGLIPLTDSTHDCYGSKIQWTGSEYGVLWISTVPYDIYFARLYPDGTKK